MWKRRIGTIQVDLDGLWTNLKYYGYDCDVSIDPIFKTSIPRFLELFEKYDIKATFFLIGKDGGISEKAALIKQLSKAGHEVANHTYSHVFGFRNLSSAEKFKEIKKGEKIIKRITGKKPVGFKAPGYDLDVETLKILSNEGYKYDSSIIPTFVYPLIMKVNRLISGGIKRTHGPKWGWMFAQNKIYNPSLKCEWKKGKMDITELPCSVMPILRWPYHATFAARLGLPYFKIGYYLTKKTRSNLNYEFHAVDLSDDFQQKKCPFKITNLGRRTNICKNIVKQISRDYEVVTSREFVERLK